MQLVLYGRELSSLGRAAEALRERGHRLTQGSPEDLEDIRTRQVGAALIDAGDSALLARLRDLAPELPVIVLGADDRAARAAEAAAQGALGYVPCNGALDEGMVQALVACVERAAARGRVEQQRRVTLEENLRTRKFYEDVLTSVGQGIVVIDPDGHIRFLNPEASRILGELDGDAPTSGEAAVPLLQMLVETLTEGEGKSQMIALEVEEQKTFLDVTTSVLRGMDGQAMGAIAIVSDRSAEKRLEEQLVHTERLATLGSLLASIAHEIKNILHSVTASAEMGLEVAESAEEAAGQDPARAQDALRSVAEEVRDTFDLVLQAGLSGQTFANNLLQYSRQSGPSRVVHQSLNQLIEKTLQMLGKHLGTDRVRLELDLDPADPRAKVEPSKVQQALVNLIVNAIQAMQDMPRERRVLRVSTCLDEERGELRLELQDQGPGIPPRRLERIWQPFFTTKESGTGLGLHITRKVIEDQGGRIEVDSDPGVGTRFVIGLPLE